MNQCSSLSADVAVIGSGFGGSVAAMRLAQKGYSVVVLEEGKRFNDDDFPKTNWQLKSYLFAPLIGCHGIQRLTLLNGILVLRGSGVGGGSLVYANTLLRPKDEVFSATDWPKGYRWKEELAPYYDLAERMLGVSENKSFFCGEKSLGEVAVRMGVEKTFTPTRVGVYFGEERKTVPDPYFNGSGPERTGCHFCGGCMVGCRYGAKNTLVKNYLYFAEAWGARIYPQTRVIRIIPPGQSGGGYTLIAKTGYLPFGQGTMKITADKIVLSAGVLGTLDLLLRNKTIDKTLPLLSDKLGSVVRTNGECLLGATSLDRSDDYSKGIAIGVKMKPDEITTIEPARFSEGSDLLRFLGVPLTGNGSRLKRPIKLLLNTIFHLPRLLRLLAIRDWAKRSIILLVMRSDETKMAIGYKRSIFSLFRKSLFIEKTDQPIRSYIPIAQTAAIHLGKVMNGEPQNLISEVLLGIPATAHILGGCAMGENRDHAVVDDKHEVFGYKGLYICDASVVPVNLGVNPSLTITAMAERFAASFPDKPDCDPLIIAERRISFN